MEVEGSDTREYCWWSPFVSKRTVSAAAAVPPARGVIVCFFLLFLGPLFYSQRSIIERLHIFKREEPFTCPRQGKPICSPPPTPPNISYNNNNNNKSSVCPDYFRWIHEDLRTWTETGITKEMVEKEMGKVHFRLLVVNGRVYVEKYHKSFQTRDVFTIWGVLQLLRKYPGQIPDLDLMFNCNDHPFVWKSHYPTNASVSPPPPVFSYCANDATLDMVFPDWSFWGWPEINIKPWKQLLSELMRGNGEMRWKDREPYAYWKGNPDVSAKRGDLLKCNVSKKNDWNARLFSLHWGREIIQGFKDSNLANQCKYRYKIYVEGRGWSVSEKYILACDSLALLITQEYHDFFSRGLMPMQHYWPVRANNKCRSIKFAVDWGNNHQQEAQAIGREASDFTREKLKMDYVYDYMYHLLNEYSKLLKFKPTVPPKAVEFCLESMACKAKRLTKRFMMDSTAGFHRSSSHPCRLPPPFTTAEKKAVLDKKANLTKHVELLERNG